MYLPGSRLLLPQKIPQNTPHAHERGGKSTRAQAKVKVAKPPPAHPDKPGKAQMATRTTGFIQAFNCTFLPLAKRNSRHRSIPGADCLAAPIAAESARALGQAIGHERNGHSLTTRHRHRRWRHLQPRRRRHTRRPRPGGRPFRLDELYRFLPKRGAPPHERTGSRTGTAAPVFQRSRPIQRVGRRNFQRSHRRSKGEALWQNLSVETNPPCGRQCRRFSGGHAWQTRRARHLRNWHEHYRR